MVDLLVDSTEIEIGIFEEPFLGSEGTTGFKSTSPEASENNVRDTSMRFQKITHSMKTFPHLNSVS